MAIKIVKAPKVYLVGSTASYMDGISSFFEDEGISPDKLDLDSYEEDLIPELAGRVCYMSYENPRPGGNQAYIKNILDVNHGSVFEHSSFNFLITGGSRSLTHELVRHRVGVAYSQLSQRYVEHNGVFVMPWEIQQSDKSLQNYWKACMEEAQHHYQKFVNLLESTIDPSIKGTERRKAARQAARSVLPAAAETKLMFTANARALQHIFNLRGSKHADKEIRMLATALYDKVKHLNLFQNIEFDTTMEPTGLSNGK